MTPPLTKITVMGDDKTGLIARVTTLLFERDINIEDLDQAVRDGLFRMTMHVDASGMTCSEVELREALDELGEDLGLDVRVRFPATARRMDRRARHAREPPVRGVGQQRTRGGHLGRDREPPPI